MKRASDRPQVFTGMVKIQYPLGLTEPILLHLPNPDAPIGHDKNILGARQTSPSRFGLHPVAKFLWLALPSHHVLLGNHSPPTSRLSGLFQPVNHRPFDFAPDHSLQALPQRLVRPILAPLARYPSDRHDDH